MTAIRTTLRCAAIALIAAACSQGPGPSSTTGPVLPDAFVPDTELLAAAEAEGGTLTTIALPRDWCNYGALIDAFEAHTGLAVNELAPNSGSSDEIEAIRASEGNPGPAAPDVVDVSLPFGPFAADQGLLAPYKVRAWDAIPASSKDPDGRWHGGYFGVTSFEVNTAFVDRPPTDWPDLLASEYANQLALPGDPRHSNQAMMAVYAASLGNGGSLDDARPGLDLFRQLAESGNLLPTIATATSSASGETPITIRWTHHSLPSRDATAAAEGPRIEIVVPASGPLGQLSVQAISAHAPHPSAAKLWMEFLYSDEGQLLWLEGYCHPVRFEHLVAEDKIPAGLLARLPDVSGVRFPTLAQLDAARELIEGQWDAVVGVDIRQ
ncbi:MAG TPA: ABC transporter substrate-binding protein [Candidatus Deferrimicrobiaceae bacterium]|nr:ABC transporter substrate-binding protein [Candidatus Deferrimicrobiaceae bacterium]